MKSAIPTLPDEALERLEDELVTLAGHINAAEYRFLRLLADYDRAQGWSRHGLASGVQWLNWQCGIGAVAARERLRTAKALEDLPLIAEAFSRGQLSYSKVRAMTRVATPENEPVLLSIALHGTATHVEKLVRKYRWLKRRYASERSQAQHRERALRMFWDDGALVIQARLPGEVGAVVQQAIEAAVAAVDEHGDSAADAIETESNASAGTRVSVITAESPGEADPSDAMGTAASNEHAHPSADATQTRSNVSAETSAAMLVSMRRAAATDETVTEKPDAPIAARRADALGIIARQFLATESQDAGSIGDRYQVVVHIDQSVLADRAVSRWPLPTDTTRAQICEYDDGRALAIETARRLCCETSLVGIVEDAHGKPLDVGRKTRAIPAAIRRALKSRDRGCRFPGCTHRRFTEGHHIEHWADGGETKLANLITLCNFHHRLVHEGGFDIRATDDGLLVFSKPDGSRLAEAGRLDRHLDAIDRQIEMLNGECGLEIDRDTAVTRWQGEPMDYGWTTEVLCSADELAPAG